MLRSVLLANAALFTVTVALGVGVDINRVESVAGNRLVFEVAVGKAEAARRHRAARRAQRSAHRVNYYQDLPKGCAKKGQYYYCNGTYYMPRYHNGRTRYVVVYP